MARDDRLLTPDERDRFTYGSVLAVKMVSALMDGGTSPETIDMPAAEGLLSLRMSDAAAGVGAALDLVEAMNAEGALSSHAGVHAGSMIERDLDVFGQTVNLASRIADVAGPGDVVGGRGVTEATTGDAPFGFEPIGDGAEGAAEPRSPVRVTRPSPR